MNGAFPKNSRDDLQYLRLLSIFHYIIGGVAAFFSFFPSIYIAIGLLALYPPGITPEEEVPRIIGWAFISMGVLFLLLGIAFSVCMIIAGRYLARHAHYIFCFVIAAIECVFFPFGTVLGVFTILVLSRPKVRDLFEQGRVLK